MLGTGEELAQESLGGEAGFRSVQKRRGNGQSSPGQGTRRHKGLQEKVRGRSHFCPEGTAGA